MSPFPRPFGCLHPVPIPSSLWPSPHCCLFPWVLHIHSVVNPVPFFHSVPHPLLACSMYAFLCFYSVHQFILFIRLMNIGDIIWYLSSSHWLISLKMIISMSIMLSQKVELPYFLWLCSIPLCKYIRAFLPTYLLMSPWAVSRSWLL